MPASGSTLPDNITVSTIRPLHSLLHLASHRNKNQHRLAKWWGPFSQLRRQLESLLTDLELLEDSATSVAGRKAARAKAEARVAFLDKELFPRCYVAFSTVVADNQYAPLGLMLMGTLASLQKVMAPKREEMAEDIVPVSVAALEVVKSPVEMSEDLGEAISRDTVDKEVQDVKGKVDETKPIVKKVEKRKLEATSKEEKKKKKKKKGDAFDDLFAGLI